MAKNFDLSGQTFGSLTVLGRELEQVSRSEWNCHCVCGRDVTITTGNLKKLVGTRCGCARRDYARKKMTTHGAAKTPEYRSWGSMMSRCTNPRHKSFPDYGGRGIAVCDRWRSFESFLLDMGRMPAPKMTIERDDVHGDYEPSNCRWATVSEQMNNKRNNHLLTHDGVTLNITQWAKRIGIGVDALERRINALRWSPTKAITTPVRDWGRGHPRRAT